MKKKKGSNLPAGTPVSGNARTRLIKTPANGKFPGLKTERIETLPKKASRGADEEME
jgi:hypothetical protein